jgi:5-methylcytosine-specific restriction endonuclease McrA
MAKKATTKKFVDYAEQLKNPKWQRKRLEILTRDNWTCQKCGDTETTLHVHHLIYANGIKAWDYSNEMLITLCEHCHKAEQEDMDDACRYLIYELKTQGMFSTEINQLAAVDLKSLYKKIING